MDLDKLMSKHLTRYFDPSKTIPEETLQQLLRFLRSTPTSDLVPHFLVSHATPCLRVDQRSPRAAAGS